MGWTPYQSAIALLMVITGSINTLSTKWGDRTSAPGRDGSQPHQFEHPFVQAVGMFIGETTCLIVFSLIFFYYRRVKRVESHELPDIVNSEKFNAFIFLIPALCDMTATSTMYLGLGMTTASSFQMLRGALIVFTGIFSVIFLKRKLKCYEWTGIFFIIIGLTIVGLNDVFNNSDDSVDVGQMITGDILIILAQVLTAIQMIVEEKFVCSKSIAPLHAVGLEGLFGGVILTLLLVPMAYINIYRDHKWVPIEDTIDALYQIKNSWQIALAVGGNVISIAFFNFAGISVTKEISATTRTVLDSIRTLVIALCSMAFGWQGFATLQLAGFVVLVIGMFVYNDVIIRPWMISRGYLELLPEVEETDNRNLLNSEQDQQNNAEVFS